MNIEKILRLALVVAHDHIHNGEMKEAHEAIHQGLNGKECEHRHLSIELPNRLKQFSEDFNMICLRYNIPSAWFSLMPTKVEEKNQVSVQMGGDPELIKFMREAFGLDKPQETKDALPKESKLVGLDGKKIVLK